MPRVVEIGFSKRPIPLDQLEDLLVEFEERIRKYLRSRVGRRIDELDIIVEADISGDNTLTIKVDARVTGRFIAPYTYDEILAEAIEEAGKWLEEQLRRIVKEGREEANSHNI